jgi:general secretion pathway protein D
VQSEGGGGIHVVYLENADAEQLAGVLSNLAQGVAGGGAAQGNRNRGANMNNPPPGGVPQPNQGGGAGGAVAVLEGDVKVTADVATNALVITASESDFKALKLVIDKLDIRRQQVYVEAVIMEIDVNKKRQLGVSFGGAADVGDGAIGFGGLNASNALFINPTALASGFALGLIGPGGVTVSVPNGTGGSTDVTVPPFGVALNVLSRPNILAKENEEAEIVIATSVAVPGNVTISQTGLQNFSITHEDVGITLRVTPKINESEYISMQLFQEVKDIVADTTTASGQRLVDTGKRSAKTNVVVKNGETIVIGGLLSDTERRSEQKVPLLGDIPFLGFLFRNTERRATKQNLLIFLTPTIISDDQDMKMIYERRIKEREEFLRIYASRQLRKEEKKRKTVYDRFYGTGAKESKEQSKNEPPVLFQPVNRPADVPPADFKAKPDPAVPPKDDDDGGDSETGALAPAGDEAIAKSGDTTPTEGETAAP